MEVVLCDSIECHTMYMEFIGRSVSKTHPTTLHIASAPHLHITTLHDIVTIVRRAANPKVIYHFRFQDFENIISILDGTADQGRKNVKRQNQLASDSKRKAVSDYFLTDRNHEIRINFYGWNVKDMHYYISKIAGFTDKYANIKVHYYYDVHEYTTMMRVINQCKRTTDSWNDGTEEQQLYLKKYFSTDANHKVNLVEGNRPYYFHSKWAAFHTEGRGRDDVNYLLTSANLIYDHLKSDEDEGSRIVNSVITDTLSQEDFQARFLTPMTHGYETVMRPVTMSLDSTDRLSQTWPAGNYNDIQIYQQVKEFVEEAVFNSIGNPSVLHIVSPFVDYATITQILLWSSKALCSGTLQVNFTYKDNKAYKGYKGYKGKLEILEAAIKTASSIVGSPKDFIEVLHDLKTRQDSQNTTKSLDIDTQMKSLSLDSEWEGNIELLRSVRVTHASDFHCKFIGYGPLASEAHPAGFYEVLMTSANFDTSHMNASKEESKKWNAPGYANLDWTARQRFTEPNWKSVIDWLDRRPEKLIC